MTVYINGVSASLASLTYSNAEVFNGTSPTAWTDLDLSGTVGAKTALVLLKCGDANDRMIAVRTNGDTDEFYADVVTPSGVALADGKNTHKAVLLVCTDSSGVIEWKTEVANTWVLDVIAYIN